MSEDFKKLPSTERLRQHILEQAIKATLPQYRENWTTEGTVHAIANGMPWIYGFIRSRDKSTRKLIEQYAHNQGFSSVAELKSSLDELREQLKSDLPEKEWNAYFKDTENIQL